MTGGRRPGRSSHINPLSGNTADTNLQPSRMRPSHSHSSRSERRKSEPPYRSSASNSFPVSDGQVPAISQCEQVDPMNSRDKADLTRATVAIPVSNSIFNRAMTDVKHPFHDFSDLLNRYGYAAIVDAAYRQSRKSDHPFFTNPGDGPYQGVVDWRFHGIQILADTPKLILEALLDGTVTEKTRSDDESQRPLQDYFDASNYEDFISRHPSTTTVPHVNRWIKRHKEQFAPSFYVRILANSKGESPTPSQIVTRMRQYISNDPSYIDACVDIDNATRGNRSDADNIVQREHHFLNGSVSRVRTILTFCAALEDLIQAHVPTGSPLEHQPFKFKAKYFGYTVNDTERSKRHDAGATKWLKSFYYSICKIEFQDPAGNPEFSWHHYVIGFAVSVDECHIGEELFCQLGSGYYYTGVGFNIQPAGISVTSSHLDSLTPNAAASMWRKVLQWREEGPDFTLQLAHEVQTCIPVYQQYTQDKQKAKKKPGPDRQHLIDKRDRLLKAIEEAKKAGPDEAEMNAAIQDLENEQKLTQAVCADKPELLAALRRSQASVLGDIKKAAQELYKPR